MVTTVEKAKIPQFLIREKIDDTRFFYKGYQSVINKTKKLEDIIGISGFQAFIISIFTNYSHLNIGHQKYRFFNNLGVELSKDTLLVLDFSIFDKSILTIDKINEHYVKVPPKVVVEVDIKIESDNTTDFDYINQKTEKLLNFGTEKVIWILSKSKKIMVAMPNENWQVMDWNKDFELIDGHIINLQKMFEEEGFIDVEE